MCQLYCCLTSPCLYGRLALNSLHQGIFQLPGQHLAVPHVTSGGSLPQGVPKACKKAGFAPTGAVCRSCITMPVSTGASPPGGKGETPFPDLKYSAPAPCRSGCRGEAPCSLRKERNPGSRNLYTAFITIESAGSTCPYHFPSSSPPLPGIKSVFLACRFC